MSIRMKDIAELTGVSINTVSRSLKDMPDISQATKERVQRTASALGYTPNVLARGLVMKRSFNIGLIATDLANPSRSIVVDLLSHLAKEHGFQLLVNGYDTDEDLETCIRDMTSRGVDGLIIGNICGIAAERPYWPALESTRKKGTPVVTFFEAITTKVDNLATDYARLTEQLTAHLIEQHGLQEICYAGELKFPRGQGYLDAMAAAGLSGNVRVIPVTGWTMADARQGIRNYLQNNARPEAIVCHNDTVAIGVMAGLRNMNVRVPEDIAVVGIDNVELAEYVSPTLTTAGMDPAHVAHQLFTLVHDRIEGTYRGAARRVELPLTFRFRESCGCKAANPSSVEPLPPQEASP